MSCRVPRVGSTAGSKAVGSVAMYGKEHAGRWRVESVPRPSGYRGLLRTTLRVIAPPGSDRAQLPGRGRARHGTREGPPRVS